MRTLATFAGMVCLLGGRPELALGQSAPSPVERRNEPSSPTEGLNLRIPEVRFFEIPLEQALEWTIGQTGCNVAIRWNSIEEAGISRDKPISLQARNLTVRKVLWLLLRDAASEGAKLAVREDADLLIVSTEADLDQETPIRTYSVADLLLRVPRFAGPRISMNDAGSTGGVFGSTNEASGEDEDEPTAREDSDAERLAGVIRRLVADFDGDESSGRVRIETFNGNLVVRAPLRIHQLIGGGTRSTEPTLRRPAPGGGGRP